MEEDKPYTYKIVYDEGKYANDFGYAKKYLPDMEEPFTVSPDAFDEFKELIKPKGKINYKDKPANTEVVSIIINFEKTLAELSLHRKTTGLLLGELVLPPALENSPVSARERALEIANTLSVDTAGRRAFVLGLEKLSGLNLSLVPGDFIETLCKCPYFSGISVDSVVAAGTFREVPYELDRLIESD